MTITMTSKHQITIPKKIVTALGLGKGALFTVKVHRNRIELVPLEPKEKVFTEKEYRALEALSKKEKGKETRVTRKFIKNVKEGKV